MKDNESKNYNNNICKEKCSICQKAKCLNGNCNNICIKEFGHESMHSCNHEHLCNCICELYNSPGCYQKCILQFPHEGPHNCGARHMCNRKCSFWMAWYSR